MRTKDLKIEAMSADESAGRLRRGGQTVGIIASGVKVTHIPTEMMAYCGAERSQMKNKNIALEMLEWRLAAVGWQDAPNMLLSRTRVRLGGGGWVAALAYTFKSADFHLTGKTKVLPSFLVGLSRSGWHIRTYADLPCPSAQTPTGG